MSDATDPSDPLIRQLTTIAACAAELVGLVADIRHAVSERSDDLMSAWVQTVPALQRVAKGIEERTAVAKAYLAALRRLADDDDDDKPR